MGTTLLLSEQISWSTPVVVSCPSPVQTEEVKVTRSGFEGTICWLVPVKILTRVFKNGYVTRFRSHSNSSCVLSIDISIHVSPQISAGGVLDKFYWLYSSLPPSWSSQHNFSICLSISIADFSILRDVFLCLFCHYKTKTCLSFLLSLILFMYSLLVTLAIQSISKFVPETPSPLP